jgi:hypothetical protein
MRKLPCVAAFVLLGALFPAQALGAKVPAQPNPSDCIRTSTLTITLDDGTQLSQDQLAKAGFKDAVLTCVPPPRDKRVAQEAKSETAAATAQAVHYFTQYRPHYTVTDSQGTFGAQVTYKGTEPVAYYFLISSSLRAAAISQVTARMKESPTGCSYYEIAAVDYTFHWSCPSHRYGTTYTESGTLVFRVVTPWGTGTATISEYFRFLITLVPSAKGQLGGKE